MANRPDIMRAGAVDILHKSLIAPGVRECIYRPGILAWVLRLGTCRIVLARGENCSDDERKEDRKGPVCRLHRNARCGKLTC